MAIDFTFPHGEDNEDSENSRQRQKENSERLASESELATSSKNIAPVQERTNNSATVFLPIMFISLVGEGLVPFRQTAGSRLPSAPNADRTAAAAVVGEGLVPSRQTAGSHLPSAPNADRTAAAAVVGEGLVPSRQAAGSHLPSAPNADRSGQPGDQVVDIKEPASATPVFSRPENKQFRDSLLGLIPTINKLIEREKNEAGKSGAELAKASIDATKVKEEWSRNEFGPESIKLWAKVRQTIEKEPVARGQLLERLGVPIPAGASFGPEKSLSGSGLPETDEMFRARLREGNVQSNVKLAELKTGQSPAADDMIELINVTGWLLTASEAAQVGAIKMNAAYQERRLALLRSVVQEKNLEGWKQPEGLSLGQVGLWAAKAKQQVDIVERVQTCAETIAAFNEATKKGTGIPGLSDLFKLKIFSGLPDNAMVFSSEGIEGKFPGTVTRIKGTVTKIELDLPTNFEPTAENLAKIKRLEKWLAEFEPKVDQVSRALMQAKNQDQMLFWMDNTGFPTIKTVKGSLLREQDENVSLTPGSPVNLKNEQDWVIKRCLGGDEFELEKQTKNKKPFNYERYRLTVEPTSDPDYLRVSGHKEFLWAASYSYQGFWGLKSVDGTKHSTFNTQSLHKDSFVVLVDNGRVRLIQVRNLQKWADAQENARMTGNVVSTAVDAGLVLSGTVAARAAVYAAKQAGEVGFRHLAKEALRNGGFQLGLGVTGFGRQLIENNVPNGHGHDVMEVRDVATSFDMCSRLAPKAMQERIWRTPGLKYLKHPKAAEIAETFKASTIWHDKALRATNKVFEGWALSRAEKPSKFAPTLGIMPLADCYYIAGFSDRLARDTGDGQRAPLYRLAGTQASPSDKPYLFNGEVTTSKQMRAMIDPTVNHYGDRLNSKLVAAAADCAMTAQSDPKRDALGRQLSTVYADAGAPERERTAAAIALLLMRTDGGANESITGTSIQTKDVFAFLRERVATSKDFDVRIAAGDTLFRAARAATTDLCIQTVRRQELQSAKTNEPVIGKQQIALLEDDIFKSEQLLKAIDYGAPHFAGLLFEIARDPAAPRAARLDAIASPAGPRLAYLLHHLSSALEPTYHASGDNNAMASLYGRDSEAVERALRQILNNPKDDPDLRALASQALTAARSERQTVNGIPLTPDKGSLIGAKGEIKINGAEPEHASIKQGSDGKISVRANGSAGQVWIIRPGTNPEAVKESWTTVEWGDRVVIGKVESGTELQFGNEALDAVARLGAQIQRDGKTPGAISEQYRTELRNALQLPIPKMESFEQREVFTTRYRAALATFEFGGNLGAEANALKIQAASALMDGVLSRIPELARASLTALTPDRLALLPPSKRDELRERYFSVALQGQPKTPAEFELWEKAVARLPEVFSGGTPAQRNKAVLSVECLLIEPTSRLLSAQHSLPLYSASTPEIRAAAIEALSRLDPDRAAAISEKLLCGGDVDGSKVMKDVPIVRVAAVAALERVMPLTWHKTALNVLPRESDPAVLRHLWNLEFLARPELDLRRAQQEFDAMRERLEKRAHPGLLQDGAAKCSDLKIPVTDYRLQSELEKQAKGNSPHTPQGFLDSEAKRARAGLLYLAITDAQRGHLAAYTLNRIIVESPRSEALAGELTRGLERALLSERPSLSLLESYCHLKPWERGLISREEVSVLFARVVQNEAAKTKYGDDTRLQVSLLEKLKQFPSEKIVPILAAIAAPEPIKEVDEQNRPLTIAYPNGMTRSFTYKSGVLDSFIERAHNKSILFKRSHNTDMFEGANGEKREDVRVNCDNRKKFPIQIYGERQAKEEFSQLFNSGYIVRGDYGDFCYKKNGKSYVEKGNGCVIEEECKTNDRRTVKLHYGDKSGSREFVFVRGDNGYIYRPRDIESKLDITVTAPDGQKDTWSIETPRYIFSGRNQQGSKLSTISDTMHKDQMKEYAPFSLDTGDYSYLLPPNPGVQDIPGGAASNFNVRRTFASDGAVYETFRGTTTVIKPGIGGHPSPEVRSIARDMLNDLRDSARLPRSSAAEDLKFAKQRSSEQEYSAFSPNAPVESIAEWMASRLADPAIDAHSLCRALIMGSHAKPPKGADDARIFVLLNATKDKSDMVRFVAGTLVSRSSSTELREHAVRIMAEVAKNGSSASLRWDAGSFIQDYAKLEPKLVETILTETATHHNKGDAATRTNLAVGVRQQVVFESLTRSLVPSPSDARSFDFYGYCSKHGLGLVGDVALTRAQKSEMDVKLQKAVLFDSTRTAQRTEIENRTTSEMWKQFDQISKKATDPQLPQSERTEARKALLHVLATNASDFSLWQQAVAVDKAFEAVLTACKTSGRGEMEQPLRVLLTQNVGLKIAYREKLADCLSGLITDSLLSRENALNIAVMALELEARFMPKPGQPFEQQSISYQTKLLDIIAKHGNSEVVPSLDAFKQHHSVNALREKAAAVTEIVRSRKASGADRILNDLLSGHQHTLITKQDDMRVPLVVAALNDATRSISQRVRAAEILIDPSNKGIDNKTKKIAADLYAACCMGRDDLSLEQRFKIALVVIDKLNPLFDEHQRNRASSAIAQAALSAQPSMKESAMRELLKLEGTEAQAATSTLLSACTSVGSYSPPATRVAEAFELVESLKLALSLKDDKQCCIQSHHTPALANLSLQGHESAFQLLLSVPDRKAKAAEELTKAFKRYEKEVEINQARAKADQESIRNNIRHGSAIQKYQDGLAKLDPDYKQRLKLEFDPRIEQRYKSQLERLR